MGCGDVEEPFSSSSARFLLAPATTAVLMPLALAQVIVMLSGSSH
jgi:hypothetical protein